MCVDGRLCSTYGRTSCSSETVSAVPSTSEPVRVRVDKVPSPMLIRFRV